MPVVHEALSASPIKAYAVGMSQLLPMRGDFLRNYQGAPADAQEVLDRSPQSGNPLRMVFGALRRRGPWWRRKLLIRATVIDQTPRPLRTRAMPTRRLRRALRIIAQNTGLRSNK